MRYEKLMEIICNSKAADWLYNDFKRTYTNRDDLNIRIEIRQPPEIKREVRAAWANKNWATTAEQCYYDIYYGTSIVESFSLVLVDGYKAALPFPGPDSKSVPSKQYQLARCVDDLGMLDEYMEKAGFKIEGAKEVSNEVISSKAAQA
jgi:hypothetical protein